MHERNIKIYALLEGGVQGGGRFGPLNAIAK